MPGFTFTLLVSFALVFVIEGLIYALFPEQAKRMMALALSMPLERLRVFGLLVAVTGIVFIYILKNVQ